MAQDASNQSVPSLERLASRKQGVRGGFAISPELISSDISRTDHQPFLPTMSRPSLSPSEIRAMGARSYVVRVEPDRSGNVTAARLMTTHAEGSFPEQVLSTVRQWRFVPRDKSHRGAWVKYFTFKAQSIAP